MRWLAPMLFCLLLWPAAAPADGDADLAEAPDGDAESADSDWVAIACEVDTACPVGWLCRETEGFCIPDGCVYDADCRAPGFRCLDEGRCVPEVCFWDNDCPRYSICTDEGVCLPSDAVRVKGGACGSTGHGLLTIALALALVALRRRPCRLPV